MKKLWIMVAVVVLVVAGVVIGLSMTKSDKNNSGQSQMENMNNHSTSSNDSAAQPVQQNTVSITNYAFSPAAIIVKVGTTVKWTNKDSVAHTVTADTASADAPNSDNINQGQSYSFTFKKAGTYAYHCTPHPYMKGTVIVTE